MSFSKDAWQAAAPVYRQILEHPFNRELAAGTLEKSRFHFYLQQDSLYLVDFARALAIAAAKAHTPGYIVALLEFSQGAIVAERSLHQHYFDLFGIQPAQGQAPGCFAYTNFLIASTTQKNFEEGLAALLPCFWIYREVGLHIHQCAAPDNPYQKWIDTYSGKEFREVVDRAIALTDRAADAVDAAGRQTMREAFVFSTRLEWVFWDSAYRQEAWPPAER